MIGYGIGTTTTNPYNTMSMNQEDTTVTTTTTSTRPQHNGFMGWCPHCKNCDGYINVGKGHWFYCAVHETKWCAGSNLFSSWQDETEDEQRKLYYEIGLDRFQKIKPVFPDDEERRLTTDADDEVPLDDEVPF